MSTALYLNKAARLDQAAQTQIEDYVTQATQRIYSNASQAQGIDRHALRHDLQALFQQWQDQTMPWVKQFDNGNNLLVVPLSEIKYTQHKKKKKTAMTRTASGRIFLGKPNGNISLFRLGGGTKGSKSFEDGINYFVKIANDTMAIEGKPRHGREIDNHSRSEFEKTFTQPIGRYQGKTSPAAYMQSKLRDIAKAYHSDAAFDRDTLSALIQNVETTWLKSAEYKLLAIANRQALRAVLLNNAPCLHDYQWLTKDINSDAQDKRLGAFMTYPGMMPLFTHKQAEPTYSRGHEKDREAKVRRQQQHALTAHIDNGLSVPASLKNEFADAAAQIPTRYLAPYHGVNDTVFNSAARKTLMKEIDMIALFKTQDYPKSVHDWSAFESRCQSFKSAASYCGLAPKRFIDHYGTAPMQVKSWRDIGDFVQKITKTVLFPIAVHIERDMQSIKGEAPISTLQAIRNNEVKNACFDLFTIPQLIRGSKEWHERLQTVNAELKSIAVDSGLSWPALIPETTAPNGVSITALTTKAELEDEGTAMDHCVGGYASSCISHGAHIFHLTITESDGEQKNATLQLREAKQGDKMQVSITQNRAEWNRTPAAALQKATQWLVDGINDGKIKVDWHHIAVERGKVAAKYEENNLINEIGFDPYNQEHCETAYNTMKRFFPKRLQGWTYQDFTRKSGIAEKIRDNLEQQIVAWDKCTTTDFSPSLLPPMARIA
jgi:hypothetical protein